MTRVVFGGSCLYTYAALEDFFSDTRDNVTVEYMGACARGYFISPFSEQVLFILNPAGNNFFQFVSMVRNNAAFFSKNKLLIISDQCTFNVFELMCGLKMNFIPVNESTSKIRSKVIALFRKKVNKSATVASYQSCITEIELKVMNQVLNGHTVSDVAVILNKTVKTVSAHKCNALSKLNLPNNPSSVYMLACGLGFAGKDRNSSTRSGSAAIGS